jgi:hypothetical protein
MLGGTALNTYALNSDEDLVFFAELINEIRLDPFSKAESLGYDRAALRESLPWLEDSYPPYVIDTFLNSRAMAHNSVDGEISEPDLLPEHDYVRTGETGGAITFLNFLSPRDAFKIIIENIFKQELNPARVSPLNLLSTDFNLLGIDVNPGVEIVDDYWRNAYFITVCLGSSRLTSEVQLLTMVNQVRSQPFTLGTYLNISETELIDNNLNFLPEWLKGYPPLMGNTLLHESAKAYSRQLINIDRESLILLNDDPLLRASDMGYNGIDVAESFVLRIHAIHDTSSQIANTAFSYLVQNELKAAPARGGIFAMAASQSGVGITIFPFDHRVKIVSSSINAGTVFFNNETPEGSEIYGIVYSDDNNDNVYTPGEGREQAIVIAFCKSDNTIANQIITDRAGHFTMTLDSNQEYRFETTHGNTTHTLETRIDQNVFLPIEFPLLP